jgi:succinyl-diaminopimelate desuccinylase
VVVDGLPFYEVLTPTTARGGRAKNIVPDSFWINVNHRFAPGKDLDDVKSLFDDLLGDEATYEIPDFAPSGSVDLDNPLLQELIATGLEVRPKQAWTDVARFAERASPPSTSAPARPPRPTRTPSTPSCRCSKTATAA